MMQPRSKDKKVLSLLQSNNWNRCKKRRTSFNRALNTSRNNMLTSFKSNGFVVCSDRSRKTLINAQYIKCLKEVSEMDQSEKDGKVLTPQEEATKKAMNHVLEEEMPKILEDLDWSIFNLENKIKSSEGKLAIMLEEETKAKENLREAVGDGPEEFGLQPMNIV
eukprot:TRINITY_DN925_c0_g1_i2.p1 TRINITY_DN925_c0_g1~~TRINITY_DN925_c0_g1_i2.p1  ORF type:complete len:164 (+),score=57.62 TRINITY_DN925_c0_g1_i2:188-679(+)